MDFSAALSTNLSSLTLGLNQSDGDIEESLARLGDDLKMAIDSYLGLTVTLFADGQEFNLTAVEPGLSSDSISGSIMFPLPSSKCPQGVMVFYAATPGAFVDLAADLAFILRLDLDEIILDSHLISPLPTSGVGGLDEISEVNQAIGVLIGRGHLPADARAELRWRADRDQTSILVAARQLIDSVAGRASA